MCCFLLFGLCYESLTFCLLVNEAYLPCVPHSHPSICSLAIHRITHAQHSHTQTAFAHSVGQVIQVVQVGLCAFSLCWLLPF